jgi:hypothetical protein
MATQLGSSFRLLAVLSIVAVGCEGTPRVKYNAADKMAVAGQVADEMHNLSIPSEPRRPWEPGGQV